MCASHKRMVGSSKLPKASAFPSGEYAMLMTSPVCPVSVWMCSPVCVSHKRTVLSQLPEASVLPSGEYATLLIQSVCPTNRSSSSPVCASYIQIPIELATARRVLSGEYAISPIVPLPSLAFAPSGKCHCGESWAKVFGVEVIITKHTIRIIESVVFIK